MREEVIQVGEDEEGQGRPEVLTVAAIPVDQAARVWPLAAPLLAPVLARPLGQRWDLDSLLARCERGYMQLWLAGDPPSGAALAEILDFPAAREARIVLAAGRLEHVEEGLEWFEKWAWDQGCVAVSVEGRRGWARVLPGYDVVATVLRKELR